MEKDDARLSDFELLLVLALVRLGSDAYGAAVAREIEERTQRQISLGAIYKTLERLGAKGYISSQVGSPLAERGGRRRKYYALTAAGAETLDRSLQDIDALRHGVDRPVPHRSTS
ncbi:MAG: PadR family transcriptional regulator [Acidobacteriota bacterium]